MKQGTKCLHEGYKGKNGEAHALPIYQSTTFNYDSSEHIGKLFDLTESGFFYTRLANPTVDAVEQKIAALEGGIGCMCTSSGQSANFTAIMNIAKTGDHIVSVSTIYGGTFNLLAVTLNKMGIEVTFVDGKAADEEIQKAFKPNTKAVFGETIANPAITVLDIEKFAKIAHKNGVPLIVDNTFATPMLCKPIEYGADIVTHSTTKYMDGHAVVVGGAIVDSGNFDWTNGKFPEFTQADESYHGLVYSKDCGKAAYITKARVQLMRDLGLTPSPQNAFLLNMGLETLHLRMIRHCENARAVAEVLESSDKIEKVSYPTLKSSEDFGLCEKYLGGQGSGVLSFVVKGGREVAAKFIDSPNLTSNVVHVSCVKTMILHPASSTHRQLSDRQLVECGVDAGMIRLSVGIEDIEDIIADLKQGLEKL